jgi:outer membrane protein assembly factor BamE (lipoprotein component of BamABCDE complex)
MADPDSQKLLDAKADAERLQYMDEERFSQVKKGMTQDEVRSLLGTANARNIREYAEDNTVGWFYRREDHGAAGVFFKEKQGVWTAVVVDFNALKPPVAGEVAADDESE